MEPVEILDNVIEGYESGRVVWRQYGANYSPTQTMGLCVQQAVWNAYVGMGGKDLDPYLTTMRTVRKHVGTYTVPEWNDQADLTFSVMLDTLKTVANGLRTNT